MLGRNPGYVTTQGQILADLLSSDGYRITSASSKINRFVRLSDIVKTIIGGRRDYDLVVLEVYSGLYFVIADVVASLCRRFNLPLVMVLHGGELPSHLEKHPRWTSRVLQKADKLIAPSSFLADQFARRGFEVEVIPNVIEIENYPFRERSKIAPHLIWMRSFHPIYNPEMAVKVLSKLKETHPEAVLTMAGTDKGIESSVKKLVNTLNLSDSVRFAGFLNFEKKISEFGRADIYINTNRVDNMPVAVVEARAAGLPVIATDVGGLGYLIQNGENGLLVKSEDDKAMVENIKKLLADPALTRKISNNGRSLAEHCGWQEVRLKWQTLFSRYCN